MAASYNAKKIILKNLTFEIMDVKKFPVRNVLDGTVIRFGRDNCFYVIALLKKKGTEKTLWEYDLYKERSSIP